MFPFDFALICFRCWVFCRARMVPGAWTAPHSRHPRCLLLSRHHTQLCQNNDLMTGVMENDAIMRLISERCNRLIVIFSKAFFESASNTFFVKFAQAISLEQRKRKIIPIITEECDIPSQFTLYHKLRYRYPEPTYFNFWERLYESVQNVQTVRTYTPPTYVTLREYCIKPNKN